MEVALYDWGPSPFCLKVRAILDYKGVAYRKLPVLGRGMVDVRRRGGVGKVPALEIDGQLITDSTDIAYALDARVPDPPLLPSAARERALCHALEDWADEALYFIGLYYQWMEPSGAALVPRAFGRGPGGWVAYRWFRRVVTRQVVGQGTGRKSPAAIAADLERSLDALEALVTPGPYLIGPTPYLCDFALLGQVVYLSRPPACAPRVASRPGLQAWLERMRALRAPRDGA